jgi:predicted nucleic acid-binding protein
VIVVDASILAPALADDAGDGERARAAIASDELAAPHLIDLEVTSVIRRAVLRGDIPAERARQAVRDLAEVPIARFVHYPLLGRIWELHASLTPCDATYVALAELLDASLVTADARLARAPGAMCEFALIS